MSPWKLLYFKTIQKRLTNWKLEIFDPTHQILIIIPRGCASVCLKMTSVARDEKLTQKNTTDFWGVLNLLVSESTLKMNMDRFNHNQQNCRAKFVAVSPMQNCELFDHSIACRNYEILRLNYKSSLQHENLTVFEILSLCKTILQRERCFSCVCPIQTCIHWIIIG